MSVVAEPNKPMVPTALTQPTINPSRPQLRPIGRPLDVSTAHAVPDKSSYD